MFGETLFSFLLFGCVIFEIQQIRGGGINMHKDTSSNFLSLKEFVSVHFK